MKASTSLPHQNNNQREQPLSNQLGFWGGLAVIALVFAAGAALTWRKWPDLIVDFGQQLYIPWRLSNGAVLYRDLFYMAGGPLSQYWHALLFKLFGPSFLTIIVSNFALTAVILLVCYRCFGLAAGQLCGFVATLAIVCVFCFSQVTGVGNYNYAAPYSHEMLHGLCLSIVAIALLTGWREKKKIFPMMMAGFCLGLTALTKPDIFLALAIAISSAFLFSLKLGRPFLFRSAIALLASMAVPLLAFFLFFLRVGNWQESLRLEFFGWRPVFNNAVVQDPYYQWCLGLDDPFGHLRNISIHTLVPAAVIAACAWAIRHAKNLAPLPRWLVVGVIALLLVAVAWRINWLDSGATLPALCVVLLALLWHRMRRSPADETVFFPLVWSVFALLLLMKEGLLPRLWQIGFTLAMPASVCAIFLLGWELPRFLEEKYAVPARSMRLFAFLVFLAAITSLVHTSLRFYQAKHLPVGNGTDVIIAFGPTGNAVEARTMNQALGWIKTNMPPTASLAAIPEGVMLNYLSRHTSSIPCVDWNPAMLAVYGATNMNAALEAHPPDYIALVEWQPYEFDEGEFGSTNYAADTLAWIRNNYTHQALFGSKPLLNGLFGIELLKYSKRQAVPAGK